MFDKLVLASNNKGKLKEFSALLAPLGIQVIPQGDLNVPECPEPYETFLENALAKARHAAHCTGLPALADDSGLCVQALGGAPGVFSARFAGEPKSDERNNALLLEQMQDKTDRRAWYTCVLVLVRGEKDPQPLVAEGIWRGEVGHAPKGDNGFGYDPLIVMPEFNHQSVAELEAELKNKYSHRGQASQELLAKLRKFA